MQFAGGDVLPQLVSVLAAWYVPVERVDGRFWASAEGLIHTKKVLDHTATLARIDSL
jgi:hypothetical protein